MPRKVLLSAYLLLLWLAPALATPVIEHRLTVTLTPQAGRLEARDELRLPEGQRSWTFYLSHGLSPVVINGSANLSPVGRDHHLARWRLELDEDGPVTLTYRGTIQHGLVELREGMGRTRQWSPGVITADGVFLDGLSGWYPTSLEGASDERLRFRLQVNLPEGWLAVSQGAGPEIASVPEGVRVGWQETHPQDQIHLIAAPFQRYDKATPSAEAQVYLRNPDPELAKRYLDATETYFSLYSELIGPYPYAKFALVENFWETGYGMPSFTLLGPRVIRLPFILHTSYPHEILHNWWGNGVFVDFSQGNWSEGLTSYLADHLLKARRGQGASYRRDTLKSFMDYVDGAADFPIREFRGRHNTAAQAIGYGKTMMVLHMLRRDLGDELFIAGLQRFYADNRFQAARFDDLRTAFEAVSGRDLTEFFAAWINRTGAPSLALSNVRVVDEETPHLRGRLIQAQDDPPFPLTVPIVIHTERGAILRRTVALPDRDTEFDIALPERPVRVAVDPSFDLFRSLVAGEAPVTLSALLGAPRGLIVVPADAPAGLAAAYRRLAEAWRRGQAGWQVRADKALSALPGDRPVWLLGWENRLLAALTRNAPDARLETAERHVRLPDDQGASGEEGIVLTGRHAGQPFGWLAAGDAAAIQALSRKVPHYGRYSYLAFAAGDSTNRIKGQWPIGETALTVRLGSTEDDLPVPPRAPLVPIDLDAVR